MLIETTRGVHLLAITLTTTPTTAKATLATSIGGLRFLLLSSVGVVLFFGLADCHVDVVVGLVGTRRVEVEEVFVDRINQDIGKALVDLGGVETLSESFELFDAGFATLCGLFIEVESLKEEVLTDDTDDGRMMIDDEGILVRDLDETDTIGINSRVGVDSDTSRSRSGASSRTVREGELIGDLVETSSSSQLFLEGLNCLFVVTIVVGCIVEKGQDVIELHGEGSSEGNDAVDRDIGTGQRVRITFFDELDLLEAMRDQLGVVVLGRDTKEEVVVLANQGADPPLVILADQNHTTNAALSDVLKLSCIHRGEEAGSGVARNEVGEGSHENLELFLIDVVGFEGRMGDLLEDSESTSVRISFRLLGGHITLLFLLIYFYFF